MPQELSLSEKQALTTMIKDRYDIENATGFILFARKLGFSAEQMYEEYKALGDLITDYYLGEGHDAAHSIRSS